MSEPAIPGGADALVADWGARVRANREQAERVREMPESGDFYAPVAGMFVDDPHRTGDRTLERLLEIAEPGDTWLDIGAGAGRYALPLAIRVREVVALDPSAGMLDALRAALDRHAIGNVRLMHARWPMETEAAAPRADVALIAHLGHDVEGIGAFLDAMEGAARRLCVAVMTERAPLLLRRPVLASRARRGPRRAPGPARVPGHPRRTWPDARGGVRTAAAARVRIP